MFGFRKQALIEAVPNFSEGRNQEVLNGLAELVRKIPEVRLLDYSSDFDHNRSVFTMLGTPKGIFQACYDMAELALEKIDMNQHEGVHPCMGSVDVIPLIPVQGISMGETMQLARNLGHELETHLHLPVYFYGEAAMEKSYRNLAFIRKESFGLKKHKTAGAVCVGARDYLVACNAILESTKLEDAKKFAAEVRASAVGGIPHLKAIGLFLKSKNKAQLSMCITKPRKLDWNRLQHLLKVRAEQLKLPIKEFELIGVLPDQVRSAAREFASL